MIKYLLFFKLISLSSQAQYLKLSTMASSGISEGKYASQVVGQSSVVAGMTSQARQGFKQPFGSKQAQKTSNILSIGERVNWSVETFPNPFVDKLTVKLQGTTNLPTRLVLYDTDANIFWEGTYAEKQTEINLAQFKDAAAGKYILQVFHHGKPQTKTLIKAVQ
jgi:hypothetical protein